jgi:hypothetical protein
MGTWQGLKPCSHFEVLTARLNRLLRYSANAVIVDNLREQGLKPFAHFATLSARLKPCPYNKAGPSKSFVTACKAVP